MRGHLWTIGPNLVPRRLRRPLPPVRRFSTRVADARLGEVELSGDLRAAPRARALAIVVPGLGGTAASSYVHRAVADLAALGVSSLVAPQRGADGSGADVYHAGLTADLHAVLASPEVRRHDAVMVVGFSLGGHQALCLAADDPPPSLRAVAAVCPPLDLAATQAHIDGRHRWLYRQHVLRGVKHIAAAAIRRGRLAVDARALRRVRWLRDYDELVVAPRFGFADAADYYARASIGPRLHELRTPALVVAAEADPMVPAASVRALLSAPSTRASVAWTRRGGHVLFPKDLDLGLGARRGLMAQLCAWLDGIAAQASATDTASRSANGA